MNPVRSLSPAIVSGHLWIYIAAPIVGAVAAIPIFRRLKQDKVKHILFVCIENSNRSQIAQAFANMYGAGKVVGYSAGSKPSGIVNPKAIAYMKEVGYDLSTHQSKALDEIPDIPFDYVITMGCGDACPLVRAGKRTDWKIPDPKDMRGDAFRDVRDMIGSKVYDFITDEME
jgi:arsenate reductase (thioredoxin)